MVTLCADLREWYVVFITEGAACATLQVSSVLCPTEWGCVSALSPDFFALLRACACVVTRVEGVGSSRTRRLCLGLGDILL